jgi:hypothetical protein
MQDVEAHTLNNSNHVSKHFNLFSKNNNKINVWECEHEVRIKQQQILVQLILFEIAGHFKPNEEQYEGHQK